MADPKGNFTGDAGRENQPPCADENEELFRPGSPLSWIAPRSSAKASSGILARFELFNASVSLAGNCSKTLQGLMWGTC
jgi:hypothetical protein